MKTIFLGYFLILFGISSGCSLGYLAKQGSYQLRLLAGAEPIEKALRSPDLSAEKRQKLILVTKLREFGQKNLHLTVNKNYKNVNIKFADFVYNVSASKPLEFTPYTWWFPIIGSVPYKGYFDISDANKEAQRLNNLGYETVKGRVGGYSTLGYFSDPVWPSMLELDEPDLAELIIHELTHATFYIPNQTTFNESLANFVGRAGARLFLVQKYGESSQELINLDQSIEEQAIKDKFFFELYTALDKVYKSENSDADKLMLKNNTLEEARKKMLTLPISENAKNIDWSRINNAYLLSFKTYNHDEALFANLLAKAHGDFKEFFNLLSNVKGPAPFAMLKDMLAG